MFPSTNTFGPHTTSAVEGQPLSNIQFFVSYTLFEMFWVVTENSAIFKSPAAKRNKKFLTYRNIERHSVRPWSLCVWRLLGTEKCQDTLARHSSTSKYLTSCRYLFFVSVVFVSFYPVICESTLPPTPNVFIYFPAYVCTGLSSQDPTSKADSHSADEAVSPPAVT
jgi:hypothetical protein